jgi:hypothetical protein
VEHHGVLRARGGLEVSVAKRTSRLNLLAGLDRTLPVTKIQTVEGAFADSAARS